MSVDLNDNTSNLDEMEIQRPDDISERRWRQGRNLARLRDLRGFTQEELAALIPCEAKYVSLMERGRRGISDKRMSKLCSILNVTESEFLEPLSADEEPTVQWGKNGADPLTYAMVEDWQRLDSVNRTRILLYAKKLLRRSSEE